MSRMLDLIRTSQVPSNLMQSAARGSLTVPPAEMLEILVYLAVHHKVFGEQARLTLAGWDEKACLAAASDPATSPDVLRYFADVENLRPHLTAALAENPSVTEEQLADCATRGAREVIEALLPTARFSNSSVLLAALQANPHLRPNEQSDIGKKLAALNGPAAASAVDDAESTDPVADEALATFLKDNATEVEAEKEKRFQPVGATRDEHASLMDSVDASNIESPSVESPNIESPSVESPNIESPSVESPNIESPNIESPNIESSNIESPNIDAPTVAAAAAPAPAVASGASGRVSPGTAAAAAAAHAKQHGGPEHVEKRDSTLQKIAKLDVKGRIALAVRGGKEERSILIRDGTKLVALAVLESPKVTDGEVEGFALQKNLLEAVLRQIPLKRRFAKNYNIMRNLVFNPRTPLDLSLGLMKGLLVHDLKNLSGNKEVPETIRKLALRMFKQKMEKKGH